MKKVKITTIILAIILVTLIAFTGVYIKTQNRMENKVKDYSFGREIYGGRIIDLNVANLESEDSKPNPEDLTVENYKAVKKTMEQRLNNLGAEDYTISLNEENGEMKVEFQEDENTDIYAYFLIASGEVKITEKDKETELLNNSMVKKATYTYMSDLEGAYQVSMMLYLTEEGQAKIEEIKNNYAILAEEVEKIEAESEKKEEETTTEATRKIAKLSIGGNQYDIDKIEDNKIIVQIGEKTTNATSINNNVSTAAEMALLINSGKYPIQYEIEGNRFEYSDITKTQILYFAIVIAIILLIVFVTFTIKYKTRGLLASISFIGFVSILSLLLRYTNVNISIEGIGGIVLVLIFNTIINEILLNKNKNINNVNIAIIDTYKEVFSKLVPIIIITLVFCFAGVANLISFGMIMFWGLLLIAVYNASVTKTLLKLKESK